MVAGARNNKITKGVEQPPGSGTRQITAIDQAVLIDANSVTPGRRITAVVANPVLVNNPLHLEGKQNCRQFKDLQVEVKEPPRPTTGTVLAIFVTGTNRTT